MVSMVQSSHVHGWECLDPPGSSLRDQRPFPKRATKRRGGPGCQGLPSPNGAQPLNFGASRRCVRECRPLLPPQAPLQACPL